MQDADLLHLLKKDPSKGLHALMDVYAGLVFFLIRNKTSDVCSIEDMEECMSDVFTAFYRRVPEIDLQKGTIKAYLCQIAKRTAIHLYKKKTAEKCNVSLNDAYREGSTSDGFSIEETYVAEETRARLIKSIGELTEPDRAIIISKYFYGESSRSISARLGLSVSAIDTRASRALKKLKTKLEGKIDG